jgi:hypothetical protein
MTTPIKAAMLAWWMLRKISISLCRFWHTAASALNVNYLDRGSNTLASPCLLSVTGDVRMTFNMRRGNTFRFAEALPIHLALYMSAKSPAANHASISSKSVNSSKPVLGSGSTDNIEEIRARVSISVGSLIDAVVS